jgi:hypothetical protein
MGCYFWRTTLVMFRLQPDGFTNRDLRALTAQLRGLPTDAVTTPPSCSRRASGVS